MTVRGPRTFIHLSLLSFESLLTCSFRSLLRLLGYIVYVRPSRVGKHGPSASRLALYLRFAIRPSSMFNPWFNPRSPTRRVGKLASGVIVKTSEASSEDTKRKTQKTREQTGHTTHKHGSTSHEPTPHDRTLTRAIPVAFICYGTRPRTYIQSYTEHSRLDSTLLDCHSSRSSTGHSRSPRRADIELRTACVGLSRTHIRAHGERSLLLSPPDFHRHVTHRAARPTVSIWVSQVTRTHKP
jgi:hypothetical protein